MTVNSDGTGDRTAQPPGAERGERASGTGPVLVLGATGKTGRRVAELLRKRGVEVRAASRAAAGPARFDWADPGTYDAALAGMDAVYLVYMPELISDRSAADISAFAARARAAGVRRIVMLSGYGFPDEVAPAERAVADAGVEWTILVPHWFSQNFSEDFLLEPTRSGLIELPTGDGRAPFIDVLDIAEVAVAALTEDGHHGQRYELSGPRALSFTEMAAEISAATGRRIRYQPQTPEEFAAALRGFGLSEQTISVMARLMELLRNGESAEVFDGVRQVLGREARSFGEFARTAARTGVWAPHPEA